MNTQFFVSVMADFGAVFVSLLLAAVGAITGIARNSKEKVMDEITFLRGFVREKLHSLPQSVYSDEVKETDFWFWIDSSPAEDWWASVKDKDLLSSKNYERELISFIKEVLKGMDGIKQAERIEDLRDLINRKRSVPLASGPKSRLVPLQQLIQGDSLGKISLHLSLGEQAWKTWLAWSPLVTSSTRGVLLSIVSFFLIIIAALLISIPDQQHILGLTPNEIGFVTVVFAVALFSIAIGSVAIGWLEGKRWINLITWSLIVLFILALVWLTLIGLKIDVLTCRN